MKPKDAVKATIATISHLALNLYRSPARRVVLYYHGVSDRESAGFEQQMRFVAKHYRVVRPSEILSASYNGESVVAITFDDGFENLSRNAFPLLSELNLPSAVFIPAGNLGSVPGWEIDESCSDAQYRIVNESEIESLSIDLVEVFSHTMTHKRLSDLDTDAIIYELKESKGKLERIVGKSVNAISYPHGSFDRRVLDIAKKSGYTLGFTINPGFVNTDTNPFEIPRIKVYPDENFYTFRLKVNGAYGVFSSIKKFRANIGHFLSGRLRTIE